MIGAKRRLGSLGRVFAPNSPPPPRGGGGGGGRGGGGRALGTMRPFHRAARGPPPPLRGRIESPPHLFCDFHDHAQLRPLLVFGKDIALLGRSKTALRRQAQLIETDEFGGLVDAALDRVFLF